MTHEQLAEANYKIAKRGNENDAEHPGLSWRTVIFFYAALHAVDHHLAILRKRVKNHDDRRTYVGTLPEFAPIRNDYDALEALSQQARYKPNANPLSLAEFQEARDRSKRILNALGFKI